MNITKDAFEIYTDLLLPELLDGICEPCTVSRLCYRREEIDDGWDELSESEQALVRHADKVLVSEAETVSSFWLKELRYHREKLNPPQEKWWWWLHKIADDTYPKERLPKWVKND
ncbi:hypothetical protein [Dethiosulfatarculus sandiegensis]|uniref:Uncharacterized protein n=1 Tax=Dethiosulfatarculus sandiegensis TaxID=1429043 RepID=A0A0D2JQH3_9BACT|nr:hypothetical protein [Dethiosulfatarculus sandiegensis]KIX11745.1 hypothetical protein X474_23015 [Dethiosulfatarculus sandiegensis]